MSFALFREKKMCLGDSRGNINHWQRENINEGERHEPCKCLLSYVVLDMPIIHLAYISVVNQELAPQRYFVPSFKI